MNKSQAYEEGLYDDEVKGMTTQINISCIDTPNNISAIEQTTPNNVVETPEGDQPRFGFSELRKRLKEDAEKKKIEGQNEVLRRAEEKIASKPENIVQQAKKQPEPGRYN